MTTVTALTAAASMQPVRVITGSETRPANPGAVLWIGGASQPVHMQAGDIWFRAAPTGPTPPEFVTTSMNVITQGAAFSQTLVLNGTSPFTFSISAGSLPAGLSLNTTTGVITGTPTASGAYSFTVHAVNAVGSASQGFSGTVTSSAVAPDITTTVLSSLTQGTAFTQTLSVIGTGPITWTISAGTIPAGLTLNSSTGVISGTPTGSGAYSFAVTATNGVGSDSQTYSGTIATGGTAPNITTTSLGTLTTGISFSLTLARTGSTPITWGISTGTLPAGLSLNSTSGVISGTPTTAGAYSFTVSATNAFGADTQAYSGTVAAGTGTDVYSIFNATVPASTTAFSDAEVGAWMTEQFYQSPSLGALPSGSKIIGVRLYIPSGSANIGQFWYGALIRSPSGAYPGIGSFPYSSYNSNGTKKSGGTLAAGWNELLFDAEWDMVPAGGTWCIGVQIGDGSRYEYNATYTTAVTQNPEGKNFFLSEASGTGINRTFYKDSVSSARWYGIDCLVRIPS